MKNYRGLLNDPEVKRWYENLKAGSKITADVYLRRVGNFCKIHNTTPSGLATMPPRELENLLLDFTRSREGEGKFGGYIASILKAIRSWLAHNHRKLDVKIKIRGGTANPFAQK